MTRERIQAPPPPQTELEAIVDEAVASWVDAFLALGNMAKRAADPKSMTGGSQHLLKLWDLSSMAASMAFQPLIQMALQELPIEAMERTIRRIDFAAARMRPGPRGEEPKPSPMFMQRVMGRLPGD